ncbi:MAG: TonB-dependent receptor [bacterium]
MKKLFWLLVLLFVLPVFAWAETKPPEVEVSTDVEASALEKYLVTTSVIKQDSLDKDPSLNLSQYLERVPGVVMEGTGNRKSKNEMMIRGYDMSHLRVYLNGIPLNTPNERAVDFSIIPKEFFREVEVIRGPPPVSYGSDASGGIVNLIPKKAKDAPAIAASILAGSFGNFIASISPAFKSSKSDIFISARKDRSDGYTANTDSNLDYAFLSGGFDLGRNLSASILYMRTTGDKGCPNELNPDGSTRPHSTGFWPNSYNWRFQDILAENQSLRFEKKNAAGISWSVLGFYHIDNNTLTGWVDPGARLSPPAGNRNQYYQAGVTNYSYWQSNDGGGKLDLSCQRGKHLMKFGASSETATFRQNVNASLSRPKSQWNQDYWTSWNSMSYAGYYLEDTVKFTQALDMTVGGRVDSCNRSSTIGNVNVNFAFTRGLNTWRLGGATTARYPTISELDGKSGNSSLVPERAVSYEIGFHRAEGDRIFDLSVFTSTVNDLIATLAAGSKYANWRKVNIFGYEGAATLPLGKSLLISPSISYACRDYGDQPSVWNDMPKNKYVLELSSRKKKGALNWSIDGCAFSDMSTSDSQYPMMPGYVLTNCMLSYETPDLGKNRPTHQLSIMVRNLFDVKYQTTPGYAEPGRGLWGEYQIKI